MSVRKIVKINEEKCNGCGICVPSCAEGALRIINGKAKLVRDIYCDGLGACLGECPQGAISIEEREAEGFDEETAKRFRNEQAAEPEPTIGCLSVVDSFHEEDKVSGSPEPHIDHLSHLRQWPVQLTLVPVKAPFLQGSDVLLTADCIPFTYGGFHQDFLKGHALLVACPKLDDFNAHLEKLKEVLVASDIKSLTILQMEVPCCGGLVYMAQKAIEASGKNIPLKSLTISIKGDLIS